MYNTIPFLSSGKLPPHCLKMDDFTFMVNEFSPMVPLPSKNRSILHNLKS